MRRFGIPLYIAHPRAATSPTTRPLGSRETPPLEIQRRPGGHESLTMRELAPFLHFISRKQLSRLGVERLPTISIPPPRTLFGR